MRLKRVFDFSLALFGLCISAPLWIIMGFAIFIEDGLPIFYAQDRIGKDGIIFNCFKFRSMIKCADKEYGMKQSFGDKDMRYTRVGKLLRSVAMDELPQLINILKGNMSFVGPRPLRLIEKEIGDDVYNCIFEIEGFKERSCVIPGLTGIGQIYLPHWVKREERFKYDIWYCQNQSFKLDLYIIFVSFFITFVGRWEAEGRRSKLLKQNFHLFIK